MGLRQQEQGQNHPGPDAADHGQPQIVRQAQQMPQAPKSCHQCKYSDHAYPFPVDPKPPAPRAVPVSAAAGSNRA